MEWKERPADVAVHITPGEPLTDLRRLHMWIGDLDEITVGGRLELLSLDERERARLLADPGERHRFLAACIFTREVMGQVTGVDPKDLRFLEGDFGRPELAPYRAPGEHPRGIRFGLSRSERALVLGLTVGRDVGIGLEVVRPFEKLDQLAEAQFTEAQVRHLRSLSERDFLVEFCRLWTRREAIANLDGTAFLRPAHLPGRPARTTTFEFALQDKLVVGSMAVRR